MIKIWMGRREDKGHRRQPCWRTRQSLAEKKSGRWVVQTEVFAPTIQVIPGPPFTIYCRLSQIYFNFQKISRSDSRNELDTSHAPPPLKKKKEDKLPAPPLFISQLSSQSLSDRWLSKKQERVDSILKMKMVTVFAVFMLVASACAAVNHTNVTHEAEAGGAELRFVLTMYRHGDRTPINLFPTDQHKDPSEWWAKWHAEIWVIHS